MSRSSSYESKMGAIGLTMQSRLLGPAPAKGSSGRCQLETATRKAEPLTGPGPRRRCLLGSFPIAFLFVVGSRVRILLPPSASPANSASAAGLPISTMPMRRVAELEAERRHLLEIELKQSGFLCEAHAPRTRLADIDTAPTTSDILAARRPQRTTLAAD